MYRITTTYPEDPRAPFYDPSKKEINPLARLYLKREKVISKNCDDNFLTSQLDVSENTEDTSRGKKQNMNSKKIHLNIMVFF